MKNIFKLFLVAFVFVSCQKETQVNQTQSRQVQFGGINMSNARGGGGTLGWFYTGAFFPSVAAHDIQGLSAVADYKRLRLGQATMKTYWLGVYYTSILPDGSQRRRWLQFGYIDDVFGERLFSDTFEQGQGGNGEYTPPIHYWNTFVYPSLGSKIEFKIENVPTGFFGPTTFRVSYGGSASFDIDLQCSVIAEANNYAQIMTEAQDLTSFSDQINTAQCSVLKNGVWSLIGTGVVQTATWPIEGHNQNPALAVAEFNMGGTKGTIYPTPTVLW